MPSPFAIVGHGTLTDTWDPTATEGARAEPGTIMTAKTSTDQWSTIQCIQLGNDGCSRGDALVYNPATLKQYSVKTAATGDKGSPIVGIAAATIASQKCGWMYIGGYVEKAAISQTVASGEYLKVGGSTAGALSPQGASLFNSGTVGNATAFMVVAVSKGAVATTSTLLASIQIVSVWGV